MRAIICKFSALDDLPKKAHRSTVLVLRALDRVKRFSCFEVTASQALADTVTRLFRRNLVRSVGGEYPWTIVELTAAGRAMIGGEEDE